MRVLHVADTHVGYRAYHRVDHQGLNQREQDVFDAFTQVVNLAIEEEVDALLHAGDLFDSVRPTNRAVTHAMHELRRLGDAGVPAVVIGGNHETPKLRETGSVLRFLDFLPHVHAIYKGRRETVHLGDLAVHGVPHAPTKEALVEQVEAATPDPDARWNVLMLHVGVVGLAEFRTGEFNELVIPSGLLRNGHTYTALGHYHRATEVREACWYAGSTERTSFKEAGEEKGVLLVDLDAPQDPTFRPLDVRPMIDLPPVDCGPLSEVEVPATILRHLRDADPEGALLRLKVRDVPRHVYTGLDFDAVRELTRGAVHAQVDFDVVDEGQRVDAGVTRIGHLDEELRRYLDEVPLDDLDRERVTEEAVRLLREARGVDT